MAKITFACDYCGTVVTKKRGKKAAAHSFCSYTCAAKWRIANGRVRQSYDMNNRGKLPHDMVDIKVTEVIDLFPVCRPVVGKQYRAERYKGQGNPDRIGYVINVNGKRINIRMDECEEVG